MEVGVWRQGNQIPMALTEEEERELENRFKDRMVEITRKAKIVGCPTQADFIGQVCKHGKKYAKRLLQPTDRGHHGTCRGGRS